MARKPVSGQSSHIKQTCTVNYALYTLSIISTGSTAGLGNKRIIAAQLKSGAAQVHISHYLDHCFPFIGFNISGFQTTVTDNDRSGIKPYRMCCTNSVSSLWLPDVPSSESYGEQLTGVQSISGCLTHDRKKEKPNWSIKFAITCIACT